MKLAGDIVKNDRGEIVPSQRLASGELVFIAAGRPAVRRTAIYRRSRQRRARPARRTPKVATARHSLADSAHHAEARCPIRRDRQPARATAWITNSWTPRANLGLNEYIYLPGREREERAAQRSRQNLREGKRPARGLLAGGIRRAGLQQAAARNPAGGRIGSRRDHRHDRQEGRSLRRGRSYRFRLQRSRPGGAHQHPLGRDPAGKGPACRRLQELVFRRAMGGHFERQTWRRPGPPSRRRSSKSAA